MKRRLLRQTWRLKALIEILPVIIALTALFSYTTIRRVTPVDLVTPISQVLEHVPVWVAILMGLVGLIGTLGMMWLIYLFCRAPIAPDGGHRGNIRNE
jgi:hypothetical protein